MHEDLLTAKNLVYTPCGFDLDKLNIEAESQEYGASSFRLCDKKIKFRVAKITPTKTGHFVTVWKRNAHGITAPFDWTDDFDFVIISCKTAHNFGQFIFPKDVLVEKGITTKNNKAGKRGIRVYPPWDVVTSKQAEKTQNWQVSYFLSMSNQKEVNFDLAKSLLNLL